MGTFLFLLLIVFLIIVFFIYNSVKNDTTSGDLKFKVTKTFLNKYEPKLNEEVIFWLNSPETEVYIYLAGTGGGQGKIGSSKESFLINYIKKNVDFTGHISNINENIIEIRLTFNPTQ
jgi:hypothetical protein